MEPRAGADRIVVMRDGAIEGVGSPEELLRGVGACAELHAGRPA
ncbi:hypothetical protein [Saccharothrix sp. HUAS TT1]